MNLPKLTIKAYLNPNEGGCDYSAHFKKHWIENTKLHPFAQAIPVEVIDTNIKPRVILFANGNQVWNKKHSQINPADLQNFIINTYVKK